MPTTDSIQIRIRDAGRSIMLLPYSSARVAMIKTAVGRRGGFVKIPFLFVVTQYPQSREGLINSEF